MVPLTAIREFLRLHATGGLVLVAAATAAMLLANSPLAWLYGGLLTTPVVIQVGALELAKPLLLLVNDGLMAAFFLLVGLELKREILEGELSSASQHTLPLAAAFGGFVVPVLFHVALTAQDPAAIRGWSVPAVTDIALALGVLTLVGTQVPASLKVFLLTVAVVGNLGLFVIIALFQAGNLSLLNLGLALVGLAALVVMNRVGVMKLGGYILIGLAVWVCLLASGVHAALSGIAVAFCIPMGGRRSHDQSPLKELERELHPWIAFGVLPTFAFANAGVSLAGLSLSDLFAPVTLGIAVGLFFGKQIGVLGASWIAVRLRWCRLPSGVTWLHLYGVALLTGVGFTMSLYAGTLVFADGTSAEEVRLGVINGSLLSAVAGYLVLRFLAGRE